MEPNDLYKVDTSLFQNFLKETPGIDPFITMGGGVDTLAGFNVEEELLKKYRDPNTTPEQQTEILNVFQAGAESRELSDLFEKLTSPERRREILQDNLEFEKERMAQAAPYKLAFALPGQIMDAFAKPAMIQMAGAQNIANMVANATNRNFGMSPAAMNAPARPGVKYF